MAVRNVQSAELPVELRSGPAFELLVSLYAAQPDGSGEHWLHLLGLALELDAETAAAWLERVAAVDAAELRRHLVGAHVPAWRTVAGVETLEAAAAGDPEAAEALLGNERYYAGNARASLADLLPLSAARTKRRLLAELESHLREVFAPREHELVAELAADVESRRAFAGYDLIDRAAGGYRYETEPGFERVVLVPHLAARPWLLLCQHETTRLICYPAAQDGNAEQRLLALGRALGDETRLALLQRLRAGDATLVELAEAVGLSRSTTHHHLGRLRAAGFVSLAGNAGGYRYAFEPAGVTEAAALLGGLAGRSL
jgi:DNA-binding transcriptional ArsR family regulator